jgi:hypothetical protein
MQVVSRDPKNRKNYIIFVLNMQRILKKFKEIFLKTDKDHANPILNQSLSIKGFIQCIGI